MGGDANLAAAVSAHEAAMRQHAEALSSVRQEHEHLLLSLKQEHADAVESLRDTHRNDQSEALANTHSEWTVTLEDNRLQSLEKISKTETTLAEQHSCVLTATRQQLELEREQAIGEVHGVWQSKLKETDSLHSMQLQETEATFAKRHGAALTTACQEHKLAVADLFNIHSNEKKVAIEDVHSQWQTRLADTKSRGQEQMHAVRTTNELARKALRDHCEARLRDTAAELAQKETVIATLTASHKDRLRAASSSEIALVENHEQTLAQLEDEHDAALTEAMFVHQAAIAAHENLVSKHGEAMMELKQEHTQKKAEIRNAMNTTLRRAEADAAQSAQAYREQIVQLERQHQDTLCGHRNEAARNSELTRASYREDMDRECSTRDATQAKLTQENTARVEAEARIAELSASLKDTMQMLEKATAVVNHSKEQAAQSLSEGEHTADERCDRIQKLADQRMREAAQASSAIAASLEMAVKKESEAKVTAEVRLQKVQASYEITKQQLHDREAALQEEHAMLEASQAAAKDMRANAQAVVAMVNASAEDKARVVAAVEAAARQEADRQLAAETGSREAVEWQHRAAVLQLEANENQLQTVITSLSATEGSLEETRADGERRGEEQEKAEQALKQAVLQAEMARESSAREAERLRDSFALATDELEAASVSLAERDALVGACTPHSHVRHLPYKVQTMPLFTIGRLGSWQARRGRSPMTRWRLLTRRT
jgi:hypothetical protein